MNDQSILWRRLDQPGHEAARLSFQKPNWHLAGTAVFVHDQKPCLLTYLLKCDSKWHTRSAQVNGWVGDVMVEIRLSVDLDQRWWLNDKEIPAVAGCIDLDLNFSPSTNLIPIRRLALPVGKSAMVQAAWLRFPSFALELLEQTYRHLDAATYRYESAGGRFIRELTINEAGFVTRYPDFWILEAD
jgi:hypothetical protein